MSEHHTKQQLFDQLNLFMKDPPSLPPTQDKNVKLKQREGKTETERNIKVCESELVIGL